MHHPSNGLQAAALMAGPARGSLHSRVQLEKLTIPSEWCQFPPARRADRLREYANAPTNTQPRIAEPVRQGGRPREMSTFGGTASKVRSDCLSARPVEIKIVV